MLITYLFSCYNVHVGNAVYKMAANYTDTFIKQKDMISTVVKGHTFTIHARYNLSKGRVLGAGAFGIVVTAFDSTTQKEVAVKRLRPYADNSSDAILTLREIRLVKHLGAHPNVILIFQLKYLLI